MYPWLIAAVIGLSAFGNSVLSAQHGGISGTIRDAGSLRPIDQVLVQIFSEHDELMAEAYTDTNGYYAVQQLDEGIYFAQTFNEKGYVDEIYGNLRCPFDSFLPEEGTPIHVNNHAATQAVNFQLDRGGIITGRIFDALSYDPIISVSIAVIDEHMKWVSFAESDSAGSYRIDGLPADQYIIYAFSNDNGYVDQAFQDIECAYGSCDVRSTTSVSVQAGNTRMNVDFYLSRAGIISGEIYETFTDRIPTDVSVAIYNSSGTALLTVRPDIHGRFEAPGLAVGTYYVAAVNSEGRTLQIWQGLRCTPDCDPLHGTPVRVNPAAETHIRFILHGATREL